MTTEKPRKPLRPNVFADRARCRTPGRGRDRGYSGSYRQRRALSGAQRLRRSWAYELECDDPAPGIELGVEAVIVPRGRGAVDIERKLPASVFHFPPVWVAAYTDSATCKAVTRFGSRLPDDWC